jgi:hypothetical protein
LHCVELKGQLHQAIRRLRRRGPPRAGRCGSILWSPRDDGNENRERWIADVADQINENTYFYRAKTWLNDIFQNLPRAVGTAPFMALEDRYRGVPAFIVGAGPSLDKNGALLAQAAKKGIVIAVNTSAPALAKHGVVPQVLACIESLDLSSSIARVPFIDDVVRAIEQRARRLERADTICYATKENQDAARELALDPDIDLIIVIGGKKSANTKHLWEICRESKRSYLVQGADDLERDWFEGVNVIGVTAGSSTPDYVIDEVEERIASLQ